MPLKPKSPTPPRRPERFTLADLAPATANLNGEPLSTLELAPRLLGALIARQTPSGLRLGRIVETEAYLQDDPASHSFKGLTPRCRSMFGRAGLAYVYRIYGVHHCLNVVTGTEGRGEAVLIRALEPLAGLDLMRAARGLAASGPTDRGLAERERAAVTAAKPLANGPGKLCQALEIDGELDGEDLLASDRLFIMRGEAPPERILARPRIGITQAVDLPWRFLLEGNPFVSRR